jgi:hypothetical protein
MQDRRASLVACAGNPEPIVLRSCAEIVGQAPPGPTEVGRKLKLAPHRIEPRAIAEQADPQRVLGEEHTPDELRRAWGKL